MNTIEGKRTFYVTLAAFACVVIVAVAGMGFKVLDGTQVKSLLEWAIPWIGGIFGLGKGIEYLKHKSASNGASS